MVYHTSRINYRKVQDALTTSTINITTKIGVQLKIVISRATALRVSERTQC
jgi:hypothetical protein